MTAKRIMPAAAAPPARASSIISGQLPALRTLMIAMSVMCYLASLAIGGLILINRAVELWSSDIAREVTVQVLPLEGRDVEADIERVTDLVSRFDGVAGARVLGTDAAAALLEPWLGNAPLIEELPMPRLVAIQIDRQAPPDFAGLEGALKAEVPGASLDTHRRWQDELTRLAAALRWLAIVVLLVIAVSAVTLVIQVTRSALEANREAVEVLYLVGAKNSFIASAVERRFLAAGIVAGVAGAVGAIATFAALALSGSVAAPEGLVEASGALLFGPSGALSALGLYFLTVPVLATVICLLTARLAVLRILQQMF